jgi:hypothetical protein
VEWERWSFGWDYGDGGGGGVGREALIEYCKIHFKYQYVCLDLTKCSAFPQQIMHVKWSSKRGVLFVFMQFASDSESPA